jgi:probable selenate reductase FAD-binding subunit
MRNLREYFRPASTAEAVQLKASYGASAAYLAGGSDLLVLRSEGLKAAIDVRKAEIDRIETRGDYVYIGGAAKLRDVEKLVGHIAGGMLGQAVRETAPWLVRNAATLAGNVANASPAADSVPALLALDAVLILFDGSEQEVAIQDVLLGPHQTSLGDRLIVALRISSEAARRSGAFIKLARSKSDIAQVNVAVTLRREGESARDVRIAVGAVAPTGIRTMQAEALLEGATPTPDVLRSVATAVCDQVRPISDWRASAEYRRRAVGVLVRRAVQRAWEGSLRETDVGN